VVKPGTRPRPQEWAQALGRARERMTSLREIVVEGTLNRMVGMTLEAVGCEAAVGGRCLVDTLEGGQVEAEVVGFSGDKLFLMPTGNIRGLMPGARVIPTHSDSEVLVGDALLGRVLDGAGRPLDGLGELKSARRAYALDRQAPKSTDAPLGDPRSASTSVFARSILCWRSAAANVSGLFAGSGVGKSVLLGMMTRYTQAPMSPWSA
jgi:flagellum-specific ATP synthase